MTFSSLPKSGGDESCPIFSTHSGIDLEELINEEKRKEGRIVRREEVRKQKRREAEKE
jgi:hypothetical protein